MIAQPLTKGGNNHDETFYKYYTKFNHSIIYGLQL